MTDVTLSHAPLRILIVDDEVPARRRLRDLLGDLADELPSVVCGEAGEGQAALALALAAAQPVDVVLVDIRMPGMDGIEFARHLARLPVSPAVIFVTAYDAYAVQAFELNAVDYLVKPVRAPRLADALRKAQQRRPAPALFDRLAEQAGSVRTHLACHERGRLLLVPLIDILYLKADLKYVAARTVEREYLLDESLTQLEEEFGERFIRLHRNALAARDAIVGFEKGAAEDGEPAWQAILRGLPERLPVSRRQWSQVRQCVKQFST